MLLLLPGLGESVEGPGPVVPGELFAKARDTGSVRVIVQLRLPSVPADSREQAIETARKALLDEIAHTAHHVLRTYSAVPLVALDASSDTLRILASSPHVLRVTEDVWRRPTEPPRARYSSPAGDPTASRRE